MEEKNSSARVQRIVVLTLACVGGLCLLPLVAGLAALAVKFLLGAAGIAVGLICSVAALGIGLASAIVGLFCGLISAAVALLLSPPGLVLVVLLVYLKSQQNEE
jgi:hypothetical protein